MTDVFLGEPNKKHLKNKISGPFTATILFPAKIVEARGVFNSKERNCLHLELDVSGTTLRYETGDHLAIWPVNSEIEVHRFLKVFGLQERKDQVIEVSSYDLSVKIPIPAKTTYNAAVGHYLDIGAPVSRHLLATISTLISHQPTCSELLRLSSDRKSFQEQITGPRLNLAQAPSHHPHSSPRIASPSRP